MITAPVTEAPLYNLFETRAGIPVQAGQRLHPIGRFMPGYLEDYLCPVLVMTLSLLSSANSSAHVLGVEVKTSKVLWKSSGPLFVQMSASH